MSNEFVSTKCRAFKQSQCRARVTRQPGFFGFQILNSIRQSCNDDFAPRGWPNGVFVGPDGPFVPWQDFNFIDPRGATFLNPTAPQLKIDGWLHETWFSNVPLPALSEPPAPLFQRIGSTDHSRLHKSSVPLGVFNSETIGAGSKVRKGALMLKQGRTYRDVTSNFGVFFPSGIGNDQIQRIKIYDSIGGTLTKHTLAYSDTSANPLQTQLANFGATLHAPTHVEEYFPAKGDPPRTFEPNEFVYSDDHLGPNFRIGFIPGTIEVLIFWFYLHTADLPAFPLAVNTASDFFFVG